MTRMQIVETNDTAGELAYQDQPVTHGGKDTLLVFSMVSLNMTLRMSFEP